MMPSAALSAAMNASIVVCMFSVAAVIVTGRRRSSGCSD